MYHSLWESQGDIIRVRRQPVPPPKFEIDKYTARVVPSNVVMYMSVFDLCAHVWVSPGRFVVLGFLQCVKGQEKGNYQQASKSEQMPVQINPNQLNMGFSARFVLISQGMQEKCGEYMRIPEVGTKERP